MRGGTNSLFSVVMPTYNRAGVIVDSLDSVRQQSYRPIEIIVVDDGSTDRTAEVVGNWQSRWEHAGALTLRCIVQENSGAAASRNRGIQECRGRYVQFLDSDDLIHPNRLELLVTEFERTGADFIQTGFEGFDPESSRVVQRFFGRPGESQLELALRGRLWANTLRSAFRRELIERTGPWNTAMTCFQDREYVERAIVLAERPGAVREVLASARRGGGTRISHIHRTYEGRAWRVHCEEVLARGTRERRDVSCKALSAFRSRIYGLGARCSAAGWLDLAKRCGVLADSIAAGLDSLGRRRRAVYRLGPWAARAYEVAHGLKERLRRKKRPGTVRRCNRDY